MPCIRGHHNRLHLPQDYALPQGSVKTTEEILRTLRITSNTVKPLQANHTIRLSESVELPKKALPLDPYCLGVWLGDGSKGSGGLTGIDAGVWEEIERTGYRVSHSSKSQKAHHIKGIVPVLRELDVLYNKRIPHDYLWASKEQRLALLQGLMDTDGSCAEDGQCEFSNTNRNLSEGVYHLAASLGMKPYWAEKTPVCTNAKGGPKRCKRAYMVRWTGTLLAFRLRRKLARLNKKCGGTQNWRYIVNVEPAGRMRMRCITVDNPTGLYLFGKNFNVTHNSEVVAAIAAYKLYLTLLINSPQRYFGLAEGSQIDFTFLAQDETGAGRLFKKLAAAVNRASWFHPYLKDNNSKNLSFICEADRHLGKTVKPSILVNSLPCTTNAVRGPSSIFLALDEFAHFRSEIGSTSEDMYVAATPAAGDFHHDAVDASGEQITIPDSLILSISSPLKKVGMMYDLYAKALADGINEDIPTFALACSSAEMNPKLPASFLRDKAKKNPITFKAEYGGQFLESTETFVREIDVRSCIDVSAWDPTGVPAAGAVVRKNTEFFTSDQLGYQYFWALDLGGVNVTDPENTKSDASALAIGHLEYRPDPHPTTELKHGFHLVYDYIDRMMAGEQFEGPGIIIQTPEGIKYKDFQVLPLKDILIWLNEMNKIMPCFKGVTDQHAGRQLITLLEQNQINNVELVNLTPAINSEMAYSLRGFINNKTANFPYVPKFLHEIKMVETDVVSKYRIRVHAPVEKGAHDDMVDAAMLVAMLAETWLIDEGHLKLDPTGQSLIMLRQQALPAKPVLDLDAVSMGQLRMAERMYQMNKFPFGGGSHRVAKRGGGRR